MSAQPNEQVFEEAAAWMIELREGGLRGLRAPRFMEWLERSPLHVAAYLEIAALWDDIPRLMTKESVDVDALIASARGERARAIFRPAIWIAALAASLVVAIVLWMQPRTQTYQTQIGELRSITLDDGSTVHLDAKSHVRVRLASDARTVELLEGQAMFHVAKDVRRPFIVSCDDTRMRAVGTQFDVYRKAFGKKVVTVVEGRVAMLPGAGRSEIFLDAGDQVVVTTGSVVQTNRADMAMAVAWTERNVVFRNTPLSEAVAELNRYNRRQIVIDDASLHGIRISGIFSSTNPASLLLFLREQLKVSVQESDTAVHISRGTEE